MKIGVKTFDDENFLRHFENKVDFFEIMAVQKNNYSFLRNFSLPMVIHAEHQNFGINPADISKKEQNLKSMNFAIKIANLSNSKKIIVHSGFIEKGNKNCSLKNATDFFNGINDDRILIENLPAKISETHLCQTAYQTRKFIKKTGTGFCFDINHAIGAMKKFNGKYNFIKKYIKLNPKHYHLGGYDLKEGKDHLCLADSGLNLKEILKFYPENAEITLETEVNIRKTEEDIEIIRNVLKELGK